MKTVFLQILDMSVAASILAAVVIVLRLLLKKAPKAIHCALWAMVALRLICPSLPESQASLMPDSHPVSSVVQAEEEKTPAVQVQPPVQTPQQPIPQQPMPQEPIPPTPAPENTVTITAEPEKTVHWADVLSIVWLSGVAVMALYGFGSYLYLRRKVAPAVKEDGIWLCDNVASPFILGIFRPRIYLPSALEPEHRTSVLAHERSHLRRKDHWWKPLGFALLAVHWFNPVMWLSYILLCRDIEAACDQRVVKGMESEERKAYSKALLSCAAPRRSIAVCPLAFGEQNAKSRIKSVLSYKKPTIWIILIALVVSVVVAACFLTNPTSPSDNTFNQPQSSAYLDCYTDMFISTGEVPTGEYVRYSLENYKDQVLDLMDVLSSKEDWEDMTQFKWAATISYSLTEKTSADRLTYYVETNRWYVFKENDGKLWFIELTEDEKTLLSDFIDNVIKEGNDQPPFESIVTNMTIKHTLPSCMAFESDCFYATDSDGDLCRIYCSDMTGLYEGQTIRVTYDSSSKVTFDTPMFSGGWSPKYEITATKVEYQPKNEYVTTVYFMYDPITMGWMPESLPGVAYYAAPVTAEERDILLKLHEGRAWHDTMLSSYLPQTQMVLNVVEDGTWNYIALRDEGYIVKDRYYAVLTQEEQEVIKNIKNRAAISLEAENYFIDDYLVYQQKTKQ